MVSPTLRRTIPLCITVVAALVLFAEYFTKVPGISGVAQLMQNFSVVISAFALGLGAANILIIHGKHVMRRTPQQWYLSIWLFIVMIIFAVIGVGLTVNAPVYVWLFNNTLVPVSTTIYALLAFYIASACYRVFRFRSKEAGVMLIAGVIVMLGNIPPLTVTFTPLFDLANWIRGVPTMAGLRAVMIGTSVGTIILGFRALLGYEKGYMGGE